jgi:hypothetical protein
MHSVVGATGGRPVKVLDLPDSGVSDDCVYWIALRANACFQASKSFGRLFNIWMKKW